MTSSWKKMQLLGGHFAKHRPSDVGTIWKAQKDLDSTMVVWPWGVVTSSGGTADAV